jgi:hypothetical protein
MNKGVRRTDCGLLADIVYGGFPPIFLLEAALPSLDLGSGGGEFGGH